MGDRGMAWWTNPAGRRVWLLIDDGAVVDATRYGLDWARGRTLTDLQTAAERHGATIVWTPLDTVPTKTLLYLTDHTPIRRWRHPGEGALADRDLTFGTTGDGWYVDAAGIAGEPHAWVWPTEDDAVALTRQHLAQSRAWYRIPTYGLSSPLPDPPYDDRRWSDTDARQERQIDTQERAR